MKLNGYRASHRNKWFLISKGILRSQEFLLFEYYLDLMAFDKSHGDKFAVFEVYFDEIASVFHKTNETIEDWHTGLLTKGFIKIADENRNLYTIKTPLRYVVGLTQWGGEASRYATDEKNQTQEFILENIRFFPQKSENILPKQNETASEPSNSVENSLGSSKDCSIVSSPLCFKKVVFIPPIIRSDEEYQKLFDDDPTFSIQTMKLADECTTEYRTIENDAEEKETVEKFFNGNWNEYRKHLKITREFPNALAKSIEGEQL